jgi:voltage-gated potassium channel
MVKLRAIQVIAAMAIIVIFLVSTALVVLDNFNIIDAILFSFLNIIGATFPPNLGLVDTRNLLVLSAVALGTLGNLAFTIMFTTVLYQILSGIDLRYLVSRQRIRGVTKHVILTPINGIGLELARKLASRRISTVFVDQNRRLVKKAIREGFMALHGNPVTLETLSDARVSNAIAVFALGESDVENTFITMAARKANNEALVIPRIGRLEDVSKMKRAGAKRVIQPEVAVGAEMGDFLLSGAESAA